MRSAGMFIYPWDFMDEGVETTIAAVRDLGITRLYMASSYHSGFFLQPHNPKRRTRMAESGVAYFHPDPKRFEGVLQPKVAEICSTTDWFGEACVAAERNGIEVCAWTVGTHNTRLGTLHPECTVHNVFGDSYPHALTPGHPAVRAYMLGLIGDLSSRYPLHSIFPEGASYSGRRHGHHHERDGVHLGPVEQWLMDMSFNDVDIRIAEETGVDTKAVRLAVRGHLDRFFATAPARPADLPRSVDEFQKAFPPVAAYMACCARTGDSLLAELKQDAAKHSVRFEGFGRNPAYDAVFIVAYGTPPQRIAEMTRAARASMPDRELIVLVRIGFDGPDMGEPIVTAEATAAVTRAAADNGADGIAFYNYSEAPPQAIAWIKPALAAARG